MANYVLASVGDVQLFNQNDGSLIVTSKTLTDSGINFSVTEEEIRGGLGNAKISSYFHDSAMGLTLTDALFNMQYLALNVGGEITASADVLTIEQVTIATADEIVVTSEPKKFGNIGYIGWYTIAGKDEWNKVVFDPTTKKATVATGTLPADTVVCVKYIKTDAAAEQFVVSSAFIPSQVYAILTLPLFKAGTDSSASLTSSSKVGEIQVEIPNFMLAGTQDLSLTAAGAATTSLSGSALVSYTGTEGCDGQGFYAKLKQITFGKSEWADVKAIVVADSDIDLAVGDTQALEVYALYGGAKAPRLIDNAKLTFTSSATATATVANGVVTAVAAGEAVIEVVVTDTAYSSLNAKAVVTVA